MCQNTIEYLVNVKFLLDVHIHFIGGREQNMYVFISSLSQMDCSLKPSQRTDMLGRRNKGKRGPEENGGGPLSEPEEGAPHSYPSSCRNKRRRIEVSR